MKVDEKMIVDARSHDLRGVVVFFVLAYLISIGAAAALHETALEAGLEDFMALVRLTEPWIQLDSIAENLTLPVWMVYLLSRILDYGPTIAGLIATLIFGGAEGLIRLSTKLTRWRVAGRWYLFAWLFPLGLTSVALLFHLLLGGSEVTGINWQGLKTIGDLFFLVLIARTLLGGGLGEEIGWRGFALPRLQDQLGAFWASLIIGFVWTGWHLPAHLVSDTPLGSLTAQLLLTLPLSFLFTWVYNKTGGNLLIAVLLHGALNGFNAFFEYSLFPPLIDEDGFVLFWVLLALITGIVLAIGMWRVERKANDEQPGN